MAKETNKQLALSCFLRESSPSRLLCRYLRSASAAQQRRPTAEPHSGAPHGQDSPPPVCQNLHTAPLSRHMMLLSCQCKTRRTFRGQLTQGEGYRTGEGQVEGYRTDRCGEDTRQHMALTCSKKGENHFRIKRDRKLCPSVHGFMRHLYILFSQC